MDEMTRTVEMIASGLVLYQDIHAPIFEVLDLIHRNNADAVVILNNGVPDGIITEGEILRGIIRFKDEFSKRSAKDIMRSPLQTVTFNADISDAKDLMINTDLDKLPVMKNHSIVGLLTYRDILNYLF